MKAAILVVLDTVGIQSYVFGSNRLRENVGASHLVHMATSGWLMENRNELLGTQRHNIIEDNGIRRRDDSRSLEKDELDAELIYAGGGNTVLLFKDAGPAKTFVGNLSRKLLCEAPGLDVVLVREPVSRHGGVVASALEAAMRNLARKKTERSWSQPLLGLSVTAACRSTGLAANFIESEPGESTSLPISAEVKAKWAANDAAKERLERTFLHGQPWEINFPDQFDHLGRSEGDQSYIAVVHADGNGMGKILKEITSTYLSKGEAANREYIRRLREFSDATAKAGTQAMQAVVDWVRSLETASHEGKEYLRLRPLVYGGDDVTFVCDGRIGLEAAQVFLDTFAQQDIPQASGDSKKGMAAAGVAIVKVRYPFARAYELSEQLCKNAKIESRAVPMLDWHLAHSGLFGSLADIRQREYEYERWQGGSLQHHTLLMRPLVVGPAPKGHWRTWDNFSKLVKEFQNRDEWPRNKVMRLREALRQGEQAVRRYTTNYGELPTIATLATEYRKTGEDGKRSVYFDAIEMIEQEIPT